MLRYDYSTWSTVPDVPTTEILESVWSDGTGQIFAVGPNGIVVHYDGASWSFMDSTTAQNLRAIAGTAPDDLFACGDAGVLLHYDGQGWGPIRNDMSAYCTGVYALPSAVYFTGASGTVLTLHR